MMEASFRMRLTHCKAEQTGRNFESFVTLKTLNQTNPKACWGCGVSLYELITLYCLN
jgi:hypothetical protein